ncbi:hypothetical protein CFE70_003711 [Pyrenophora teres f. teres 0-1]
MACRSAYNDSPVSHNGFITAERTAWANLNFFYARITQKKIQDLSIYAIFALREALETPPSDSDAEATPAQQCNPARGGALWTGTPGFTKARWELWKERFAALADMQGVQERTRVLARDAVEAMERSETYEYMR